MKIIELTAGWILGEFCINLYRNPKNNSEIIYTFNDDGYKWALLVAKHTKRYDIVEWFDENTQSDYYDFIFPEMELLGLGIQADRFI